MEAALGLRLERKEGLKMLMNRGRKTAWLGFGLLAGALALGVPLGVAAQSGGERFTATVVDLGNASTRTTSAPVVIHIYRYTTDEEIQRLAQTLKDKGPEALREALWDLEAGHIRVGGGLGYPIAVARSRQTDKGRSLNLMIDRPVQFAEFWNSSRSLDYPFGFIQLDLDQQGKGEGRIIPAAKVRLIDNTVDIESYGIQPARLLNVTQR